MFGLTSLYFLVASTFVYAAPVPRATLDTATLLKNGQTAQNLNAQFQNLTATEACNTGDVACIGGDLASCVDDKWKTESCPNGLSCFAVPMLSQTGVNVTCTSEKNALSMIHASGATDVIALANDDPDDTCESDNGDDNEDDGDDTCESEGSSSAAAASTKPPSASATKTFASTATSTPTADGGETTITVTVTPSASIAIVTVPASTVFTLPPTTTVVTGADAASILSLLSAEGHTAVTTIVNAAPSGVPSDPNAVANAPSVVSGSASASASSRPIIQLTGLGAAPTLSAANNANAGKPVLTLLPVDAAAATASPAANPFPFSDY
ncbi:hypothetical protein C8R44DRAFT_811395 [Mycena epipterygia]|nr:hypothetical protein C8R44DRAFT_811395 [Mycena epipterygia]